MFKFFSAGFFITVFIVFSFCGKLCGQIDFTEVEEYTYNEVQKNKQIITAGFDFLIPQGDFANKIGKNSLGGSFSYFKQINYSRFFLGINITSRRLDSYQISEYKPDVNQSTKVTHFTASLAGRVYPALYLHIMEFFFEGGAGLNSIRGTTSKYDVILEQSYDSFTESSDQKAFAYGGAGFHIPFNERWLLTGHVNSLFGPTIDYIAKIDDLSNITESYLAFDFKSTTFRATSISLSLSLLF